MGFICKMAGCIALVILPNRSLPLAALAVISGAPEEKSSAVVQPASLLPVTHTSHRSPQLQVATAEIYNARLFTQASPL